LDSFGPRKIVPGAAGFGIVGKWMKRFVAGDGRVKGDVLSEEGDGEGCGVRILAA
jgi:hypothetical protein